jgi:hypothetical protein
LFTELVENKKVNEELNVEVPVNAEQTLLVIQKAGSKKNSPNHTIRAVHNPQFAILISRRVGIKSLTQVRLQSVTVTGFL